MRFRVRVVLILAILTSALGAWIGFTLHRAAAEFDRQKARVARDIAALRSRLQSHQMKAARAEPHRRTLAYYRSTDPQEPFDDLSWLGPVMSPPGRVTARHVLSTWHDSGRFFPYEEDSAIPGTVGRWIGADLGTPTRALVALGVHNQFHRGLGTWGERATAEKGLLLQWKGFLQLQRYSSEDLRSMAASFETLWETRLSLFDEFAAEYARVSSGLIRKAENPHFQGMGFSGELRPGWKHLYSRKLLATSLLRIFEDDLRILSTLESLPVWERPGALPGDWIYRSFDNFGNVRVFDHCKRDRETQTWWTLVRVGFAIARYQAEKGSLPPSLSDLVPAFLPAVPPSPMTGHPLSYEKGRVLAIDPEDPESKALSIAVRPD